MLFQRWRSVTDVTENLVSETRLGRKLAKVHHFFAGRIFQCLLILNPRRKKNLDRSEKKVFSILNLLSVSEVGAAGN